MTEPDKGGSANIDENDQHDQRDQQLRLRALGEQDQALFNAVETDDEKKVLLALTSGANINAQDDRGMTPVMWALLRGHRASLGALMASGLDHSVKDHQGQSIFDYFPRFGSLSNERLSKTSCVIAALAVEDILNQPDRNPQPCATDTGAPT